MRDSECYCPRFEPARTEKLDDSECNFRCTDQGKRDFACGGARARSMSSFSDLYFLAC